MAAARARRGISRPKLLLEYLPPKSPAQNSRSNISRPNLPPLVVILSEKGEGWHVLSRLADARCDAAREEERPPSRLFWKRLEGRRSQERGGARSEGRSPTLQKARQGGSRLVGSGRRIVTGRRTWLSWSCCSWSEGRSESVQSRDPAGGTERLPFPPSARESAGKSVHFPENPVRAVGRTTRAGARHEPVDHAGGTRSCGRQGLDDTHREVATSFSFGVLCKCLWVAPVL